MADATQLPLLPGEHPPMPEAVKVEVIDDGTQRHHSARTKARKAALDVLYQSELRDIDPQQAMDVLGMTVRPYTWRIVDGVFAYLDEIDDRLADAVRGDWTLERMPGVDRTLARIAVWEMDYAAVRPATAISEAIALADEYSTDESAAFLNGLLGRVAETVPVAPVGGDDEDAVEPYPAEVPDDIDDIDR
jgi:N utilization substance protein B